MAGIAASVNKTQQVIGFAVLANAKFLDKDILKMANECSGIEPHNAKIIHDFHFGRYGRTTGELDKFIKRFESENKIPIEPIYTGKMFFGLYDMIKGGYFVRGEKVLVIHSGGIQTA
jgi:1-aminocyclopropane-1-carboxylate deaminase/D-cysteine desulfhydrase-like pyridoxal-dependent ACC family enzyme